MFPNPLRSQRSFPKLKKGKSFTWPSKAAKAQALAPEVDFAAFCNGLPPADDHVHVYRPRKRTISVRRAPRVSTRTKRDTILLDLSNNDLIPALDYAFAILDDEGNMPACALPPAPPPKMPALTRGSSAGSGDMPCTPSSSRVSPVTPSVRSSPPRYVSVAGQSFSASPSVLTTPLKLSARPSLAPCADDESSFDPDELSLALVHAQGSGGPDPSSPASEDAVPFPPPPEPPATRVPLLLRKPRMHSRESSFDGHDSLPFRSYPGSSKVSLLARSVSSLGHHHSPDIYSAARSTLSLDTPDSTLSLLLAQRPSPSRSSYGSLRLFSKKPNRTPSRRASTPPPSRARPGILTSIQPPVPPLSDVFLLGSAVRRKASMSSPPSLLERATRAHTAM